MDPDKASVVRLECPHCGYRLDRASDVSGAGQVPGDGDLTLCIECGQLAFFDASVPGGLRRVNVAEQVELLQDVRVLQIRMAWRALDAKRRREGWRSGWVP